MIYQQTDTDKDEAVNASYKLGASNTLKVKFDFSIPNIPENLLMPIKSRIELMDADMTDLITVNPDTYNIPWTLLNTAPITTYGFLYYETTFVVNGDITDTSLLEKYLKKCKTIYSVKGGEVGAKEFYTYDSVHISVNKHHLVMRKYITLNR
jgi:hypothetical protein